jgi:AraC-like DNA-binding protein
VAAVVQAAEDRSASFEQAVLLALASPAASPPEVLSAWAALVKLDAGAESSPRDRLDFPVGALRLVRSGAADHRCPGLQTAVWTSGNTIAAVAHWDPADADAQAQAGRWRDSLASLTRISGGLSLRMTALVADGLWGWESLRTALVRLADALPLRAVAGTGTLHSLDALDRRVTDPAARELCDRIDPFLAARDRGEFQNLESLAEACVEAAQGPVPSAPLEAMGRHLAFRTGLKVDDPAPKGGAWADWARGLVDLARSEAPDSRRDADVRGRVIERVDQYLRTHLADEVRVPDLASSLGLSPNYLSTVYRQFSGVTLSERLASLRLDRARELLAKPGSQVKEVAVAVGYKGARHFARLYHERFGQYPSGR